MKSASSAGQYESRRQLTSDRLSAQSKTCSTKALSGSPRQFFVVDFMDRRRTDFSRVLTVTTVMIIAIIVLVSIYGALTYPRTVVDFPMSFTVGAASQQKQFSVPLYNSKVQVQVSISSGGALWSASITNNKGATVWNHREAQGEQTTYQSPWINLHTGNYNFTFGTVGAGTLNAQITVTAKGGFW